MQPLRYLRNWLAANSSKTTYLFLNADLRALFPNLSDNTFKTLLSRAVQSQDLERPCRGVYVYSKYANSGLTLYHIAARLRAHAFNYLSLESVLSEAGVISQIPLSTIFLMSSGRSSMIFCGRFGTIEFIHTKRNAQDCIEKIQYDDRYHIWRANVPLALNDMKITRRSCDLIDWEAAREYL